MPMPSAGTLAGTSTMHSLSSACIGLGRKPSSNSSSIVATVSGGDSGWAIDCCIRAIIAACSGSSSAPPGGPELDISACIFAMMSGGMAWAWPMAPRPPSPDAPAGRPGRPLIVGMLGIDMPPGSEGMPARATPAPPLRRSKALMALDSAIPLHPMPLRLESSASLIIDVAACWAICLTMNNRAGATASLMAGASAAASASVIAHKRLRSIGMADLLKTCNDLPIRAGTKRRTISTACERHGRFIAD